MATESAWQRGWAQKHSSPANDFLTLPGYVEFQSNYDLKSFAQNIHLVGEYGKRMRER